MVAVRFFILSVKEKITIKKNIYLLIAALILTCTLPLSANNITVGTPTLNGADNTFTTGAPAVTTNAATGVGPGGATLNGTVNANGSSTTVTFEYGLTTAYGTTVTADQSPVTGTINTAVSKAISGLSNNTTYYFRVVGTNATGTTNGADNTFTTGAPTVTTDAVSAITATTASSGGNVTADGGASVTARGACWSTSANPTTADNTTADGTGMGAFTSSITGLSPGTTYHIRAYATNSAGTSYGSDESFTTLSFDFGDAPDPLIATAGQYPTLLVNNGPRHVITSDLYLGASVDIDLDGQQNLTATGDDTDGTDDEDGVNPIQLVLFKGIAPNINVILKNTTGNPATLSGWIDYDRNGIFDATERAQTAVPNGATSATLTFPAVPLRAPASSYARFRIATNAAQVAVPTGAASDGEVEDYPVAIGGVQVVLISPTADEWIRGSAGWRIEWNSVPPGVGSISLHLSTDGGWSYPHVIAEGLPNNGFYIWEAHLVNSQSCRIRIEVHGSLLAQNISGNFTIDSTPPHVVLTNPQGGETWIAGGTYPITWNPATDNFRLADKPIALHYTLDDWKTYGVIASDLANSGRYDWTVPAGLAGATTLQVKVRAVDKAGNVGCGHHNGTITVQSASFPMMITYPNGGETLAGGSVQTITWTSNVPSSTVNFSFSLDGGNTYPHEIASGEANDGAFGWTVPTLNTRDLRIRIETIGAISEEDVSDANVTVDDTQPVVSMTSPNGGEILEAGGQCFISWTARDNYGLTDAPITLLVSINGGATFPRVIAEAVVNDSSFTWNIPASLNSQEVRFKVEAEDRAGLKGSGMSGGNLSIVPADLALISPAGGEMWQGGTIHEIAWTSALPEGTVTLNYSTDGGGTYPHTIATDETNDGSYAWTLPTLNSQTVRVRILVNSAQTQETANHTDFTIDSSPPGLQLQSFNGGDSLEAGAGYEVRWTATDNFGLVEDPITLTYSTDGGRTFPHVLVEGAINDSGFVWTTPGDLDCQKVKLKIDIEDQVGFKRSVTSASSFAVMPVKIDIVSPDGGEVWRGMTTQPIAWTSNFTSGLVTLSYSTDGGFTYPHLIASGLENRLGRYEWEVPQVNEESVRVQAQLQLQNLSHDMSGGNFEIQHHAPEVRIVYPNGGETWEANSVNQIIWTARDDYFGLITDPIAIHYSTDGGRTFPHTIATREINDSTHVWTTPRDLNSPNVRIKVEALNVRDVSGYDMNDEDMGILNPPPVLSSLPDSSFENQSALYFPLNPYVHDNNDKLVTLMWSAWSSDPVVEVLINNDNKWCTILARNWTGEADIVITVTDPFGDADSDTMHVKVNGQTEVEEVTGWAVPEEFVLHQNYPNPFNPETTISYGLPEASEVIITIFGSNGRKIIDLFEGKKEKGIHALRWNAIDVPSGVYFIRMRAGRISRMRKCILMK